MTAAEKRRAWEHIKKHSPHQESFARALKESFCSIELVSYRTIKNPAQASDGSSNQCVLADTDTQNKGVSICKV